MAETQINVVSAVVVEASMSVSQAKSFFVQGVNIGMKMTGAIAGNSATGRKKLTARQWAALIEFCGVETHNQVQMFWKLIVKAWGATEVCTIVVIAIK